MGKKSSRSSKTKHLRPPLSVLDKSIYIFGLLLSFVVTLLLVFAIQDARDAIAFQDEAVVARTNHPSSLFAGLFMFYFEISAIGFFSFLLSDRKPLFGNRKIRYGEYPWEKDCYPLFCRSRKPVYGRPAVRSFRRRMLCLWCAGLLLTVCFLPLAFFGRTCLRQDQVIVSYDVFNRPKEKSYSPADYSALTLQAVHVKPGRGAAYWKYEIILTMTDGKELRFSNREFRGRNPDSTDLTIKTMSEVKARFPADAITVKGAEHLDEVADFIGMSRAQTEALYRLFGEEAEGR